MTAAAGDAAAPLALTVVVPAHRCTATLPRVLAALRASELPPACWELVVVDDASGDDTPAVAAPLADRVVRVLDGPRGPAHARNRGAAEARGAVLAFVDADVAVHPDALPRMLDAFAADPALGAVFGAYDTAPPAPGLVSRYCNLTHHWTHVRHAGPAETFWAGCGAVRCDVFREVGGFDERRYRRPQIEDIELGHRIRDLGYGIALQPAIRGTHLKLWTLRNMVVTSVQHRGVPWVELLLAERNRARASVLNVGVAEQGYTALVGLGVLAFLLAAGTGDARWLALAGLAVGTVLVGNRALFAWLGQQGGPRLAMAGVLLRLLYYVLNGVSVVWGSVNHVRARRSPSRARPVRTRSMVDALPPVVDR